MKAKPYKFDGSAYQECEPVDATHIMLNLPGPTGMIRLPVMIHGQRQGTPNWSWNGSTDNPTVRPSVLTRFAKGDKEEICHSWIGEGKIAFLLDSTHEFSGKTMELLEVDL